MGALIYQLNDHPAIQQYISKNKAYFDNRTRSLEVKGALPDESLNLQAEVIRRAGTEPRLEEAFGRFNTRRSRIFGKGADGLGKESPEHKAARQSAEKLMNAWNELRNLEGGQSSPAWKTKAQEVSKLASETSKAALKYMQDKKMSAVTGAGKERLNGAIDMHREAQLLRCSLKKQLAAAARYEEVRNRTAVTKTKLDPQYETEPEQARKNAEKALSISGKGNPKPVERSNQIHEDLLFRFNASKPEYIGEVRDDSLKGPNASRMGSKMREENKDMQKGAADRRSKDDSQKNEYCKSLIIHFFQCNESDPVRLDVFFDPF